MDRLTERERIAVEALVLLSQGGRDGVPPGDRVIPSTSATHSGPQPPDASAADQRLASFRTSPRSSSGPSSRHRSNRDSLRERINIDELWTLDPAKWPPAALALASLPAQRTVTKNNNPFRPDPEEWNVTAAVGQCVGEEAATPCTRCKTRKVHPFTGGCIVLPPELANDAGADLKQPECCFNCRYQWQYAKCKWEE